jgi:hypothetical protein
MDEEEPPAPPASGGLLGAMLALVQARPSLAQPLRSAQVLEEGDAVVLQVTADFLPLARMHADEYRELAKKASGRARPLRVEEGGGASPSADAPPAPAVVSETDKKRLHEEAARQPAVKEMLDLFGGRIVDVRESKEERP